MVAGHEGHQRCYDGFSFRPGRADCCIRPLRGEEREEPGQEKSGDDEDDRYFDEGEAGLCFLVQSLGTVICWECAESQRRQSKDRKSNAVPQPVRFRRTGRTVIGWRAGAGRGRFGLAPGWVQAACGRRRGDRPLPKFWIGRRGMEWVRCLKGALPAHPLVERVSGWGRPRNGSVPLGLPRRADAGTVHRLLPPGGG